MNSGLANRRVDAGASVDWFLIRHQDFTANEPRSVVKFCNERPGIAEGRRRGSGPVLRCIGALRRILGIKSFGMGYRSRRIDRYRSRRSRNQFQRGALFELQARNRGEQWFDTRKHAESFEFEVGPLGPITTCTTAMTKTEIRIPASTSNLGASFDACGLALSLYLTVTVENRTTGFELIPS